MTCFTAKETEAWKLILLNVPTLNENAITWDEKKRNICGEEEAGNMLARAFQALFNEEPVLTSILPDNFQYLIWRGRQYLLK